MKKISIAILVLAAAFVSCKKTPEVNLKYVDIERDLVTVGTTTANIQCDYDYITTLKKAYLYYGEGGDETDMTSAEMRVVQKTLYVELTSLKENTTYSYYYEFINGFNSMRSSLKTFKTESGGGGGEEPPTPVITLPTVITASVAEITTNSAQCGGEVTNDGGAEVTERGICWSTNANPSLSDNHVVAGSGSGEFTALMDSLGANTTYHVRAYAMNVAGTAYGLDREFVTLPLVEEHEWVDLGLPSGILWATYNVGASSPEEYGDYFAWGEIQPKDVYDWSTYIYCYDGNQLQLTKYCDNPNYGYNGFTDNLTTLEPGDDAAAVNWGNGWRMPTIEEWSELYHNTTSTWITINGVYGRVFTANNSKSVFLPAAGQRWEDEIVLDSISGIYWSSSLNNTFNDGAYYVWFDIEGSYMDNYGDGRRMGRSVRPVRSSH